MRGAGPDAVVSGEVLDQAAEFRVDGPRGRDGAGVGRLRDPQRFVAVTPDAVVHAEREFVAVGIIGQPVCRLGSTTVHLEWPAGIVRRCTGFFGAE